MPFSLAALVVAISPLDQAAMAVARAQQDQLTKPPGSLGRLEDLAVRLAGIAGRPLPHLFHPLFGGDQLARQFALRKAIIVMAGDHGVTAEGVSAYPAEVTPQMVHNFLVGGAAINQLAAQSGARVIVVDVGVAADLDLPGLVARKVAPGTANMAQGPAMTPDQALAAIQVGAEVLQSEADRGLDLVGIGEMGIGNTTAASALTAVLTGEDVGTVTGHGTGIAEPQRGHKVAVIARAIQVNQPDRDDPLDVLAKVGSLEIAGLVGVILAAAARHIPVVLDGFIAGSAALVAARLCPAAREYCFAGHVSQERGHRVILEALDLAPLLDLGMRLGEGTGAALAMGIIEGALRAHCGMATFADAGVSDRTGS